VGANKAVVNGYEVPLDVAPAIVNSRTVVPLRFVAENSGSFVDWNPEDKTISIKRIGNLIQVLFFSMTKKVRTLWYMFMTADNQFHIP